MSRSPRRRPPADGDGASSAAGSKRTAGKTFFRRDHGPHTPRTKARRLRERGRPLTTGDPKRSRSKSKERPTTSENLPPVRGAQEIEEESEDRNAAQKPRPPKRREMSEPRRMIFGHSNRGRGWGADPRGRGQVSSIERGDKRGSSKESSSRERSVTRRNEPGRPVTSHTGSRQRSVSHERGAGAPQTSHGQRRRARERTIVTVPRNRSSDKSRPDPNDGKIPTPRQLQPLDDAPKPVPNTEPVIPTPKKRKKRVRPIRKYSQAHNLSAYTTAVYDKKFLRDDVLFEDASPRKRGTSNAPSTVASQANSMGSAIDIPKEHESGSRPLTSGGSLGQRKPLTSAGKREPRPKTSQVTGQNGSAEAPELAEQEEDPDYDSFESDTNLDQIAADLQRDYEVSDGSSPVVLPTEDVLDGGWAPTRARAQYEEVDDDKGHIGGLAANFGFQSPRDSEHENAYNDDDFDYEESSPEKSPPKEVSFAGEDELEKYVGTAETDEEEHTTEQELTENQTAEKDAKSDGLPYQEDGADASAESHHESSEQEPTEDENRPEGIDHTTNNKEEVEIGKIENPEEGVKAPSEDGAQPLESEDNGESREVEHDSGIADNANHGDDNANHSEHEGDVEIEANEKEEASSETREAEDSATNIPDPGKEYESSSPLPENENATATEGEEPGHSEEAEEEVEHERNVAEENAVSISDAESTKKTGGNDGTDEQRGGDEGNGDQATTEECKENENQEADKIEKEVESEATETKPQVHENVILSGDGDGEGQKDGSEKDEGEDQKDGGEENNALVEQEEHDGDDGNLDKASDESSSKETTSTRNDEETSAQGTDEAAVLAVNAMSSVVVAVPNADQTGTEDQGETEAETTTHPTLRVASMEPTDSRRTSDQFDYDEEGEEESSPEDSQPSYDGEEDREDNDYNESDDSDETSYDDDEEEEEDKEDTDVWSTWKVMANAAALDIHEYEKSEGAATGPKRFRSSRSSRYKRDSSRLGDAIHAQLVSQQTEEHDAAVFAFSDAKIMIFGDRIVFLEKGDPVTAAEPPALTKRKNEDPVHVQRMKEEEEAALDIVGCVGTNILIAKDTIVFLHERVPPSAKHLFDFMGHSGRKKSNSGSGSRQTGLETRRRASQAATKIQSIYRGHKARVDLAQEADAATHIQAVYRGHKARHGAKDGEKPAQTQDDSAFEEKAIKGFVNSDSSEDSTLPMKDTPFSPYEAALSGPKVPVEEMIVAQAFDAAMRRAAALNSAPALPVKGKGRLAQLVDLEDDPVELAKHEEKMTRYWAEVDDGLDGDYEGFDFGNGKRVAFRIGSETIDFETEETEFVSNVKNFVDNVLFNIGDRWVESIVQPVAKSAVANFISDGVAHDMARRVLEKTRERNKKNVIGRIASDVISKSIDDGIHWATNQFDVVDFGAERIMFGDGYVTFDSIPPALLCRGRVEKMVDDVIEECTVASCKDPEYILAERDRKFGLEMDRIADRLAQRALTLANADLTKELIDMHVDETNYQAREAVKIQRRQSAAFDEAEESSESVVSTPVEPEHIDDSMLFGRAKSQRKPRVPPPAGTKVLMDVGSEPIFTAEDKEAEVFAQRYVGDWLEYVDEEAKAEFKKIREQEIAEITKYAQEVLHNIVESEVLPRVDDEHENGISLVSDVISKGLTAAATTPRANFLDKWWDQKFDSDRRLSAAVVERLPEQNAQGVVIDSYATVVAHNTMHGLFERLSAPVGAKPQAQAPMPAVLPSSIEELPLPREHVDQLDNAKAATIVTNALDAAMDDFIEDVFSVPTITPAPPPEEPKRRSYIYKERRARRVSQPGREAIDELHGQGRSPHRYVRASKVAPITPGKENKEEMTQRRRLLRSHARDSHASIVSQGSCPEIVVPKTPKSPSKPGYARISVVPEDATLDDVQRYGMVLSLLHQGVDNALQE